MSQNTTNPQQNEQKNINEELRPMSDFIVTKLVPYQDKIDKLIDKFIEKVFKRKKKKK